MLEQTEPLTSGSTVRALQTHWSPNNVSSYSHRAKEATSAAEENYTCNANHLPDLGIWNPGTAQGEPFHSTNRSSRPHHVPREAGHPSIMFTMDLARIE